MGVRRAATMTTEFWIVFLPAIIKAESPRNLMPRVQRRGIRIFQFRSALCLAQEVSPTNSEKFCNFWTAVRRLSHVWFLEVFENALAARGPEI
jgi:hypothetical protein